MGSRREMKHKFTMQTSIGISTTLAPTCISCRSRACFSDKGNFYAFCGKGCAQSYEGARMAPTCVRCRKSDCWRDPAVNRFSAFCSISCRDNHTRSPGDEEGARSIERCTQVTHCTCISVTDTKISFYSISCFPSNFYLGNFYPSILTVSFREFRCAEAAFQAGKFFRNTPSLVAQLQEVYGSEAFDIGRRNKSQADPDWRKYRQDWMRTVVRCKFEQNSEMLQWLKSTGTRILNEHSHRDDYWGDNGNGTGQNVLGQILMEVRALL